MDQIGSPSSSVEVVAGSEVVDGTEAVVVPEIVVVVTGVEGEVVPASSGVEIVSEVAQAVITRIDSRHPVTRCMSMLTASSASMAGLSMGDLPHSQQESHTLFFVATGSPETPVTCPLRWSHAVLVGQASVAIKCARRLAAAKPRSVVMIGVLSWLANST
jgi:hypothetical protein